MNSPPPFHLAIPVSDLAQAVDFYVEVLGCKPGRSAEHWVDFNFYGHQLVCHKAPSSTIAHNQVDKHAVPVPHFGVILSMPQWQQLAARLSHHKVDFVIEPNIRFRGQLGEQATFFCKDPSGNALEFKAFANPKQLFAS